MNQPQYDVRGARIVTRLDVRDAVVAFYLRTGRSARLDDIAEQLGCAPRKVSQLIARYRRTGSVAPTQQKNGPDAKLGDDDIRVVRELLEAESAGRIRERRRTRARSKHRQSPGTRRYQRSPPRWR
ncbi:Hypothetical protein I5071_370 (plasmid) [Sandaracinus amylolyticus]|uniref:hypothetical protein n=1 Tax=Sandaracinus sp. TaxID=2024858 RepID=UPI0019D44A66|nr:hypothetical protein [Sandaracinus sp.]UJR87245.1 Hypothetical protein I5071_370 [Sandaracinus amylolyticus]